MKPVVLKSSTPYSDRHGRVLPPLILYLVGVPGVVCILLWLIFFRG
jgi:hypothetical protein